MAFSSDLPQDDAFYPEVPPISLELTSKCNLKCPYCANSMLSRPSAFIDWELLEKIVDECADNNYNIAALHGTGEPLLWNRLEEVIRLIKDRGAGTGSFATNGTLLSAARVKRLLDAGMTDIRISLDSLDPDIYAATRGGKVQKVIDNILKLIELTPNSFKTIIVLMRHKDQAIDSEQIAQFYKTFGFHENVTLEIVDNGLMVSSPEDFREHPVKVARCTRPRDWFTITSEGKVSVCCSDQNALGVLGDIRVQSIKDVWYSRQTQKTLSNIALGRGECPEVCTEHCWLEKPQPDAEDRSGTYYDWPVSKGFGQIEQCILDGDFARGGEILAALQTRVANNDRLAYFAEILNEPGRGAMAVHSEDSRTEMIHIAEEAMEKDQLIQKHHDFARQLLAELEEREIAVATQWK